MFDLFQYFKAHWKEQSAQFTNLFKSYVYELQIYCPGAQGFGTKQNKTHNTNKTRQNKQNHKIPKSTQQNKTHKKQTNKKTQTKPVTSPLWANIIIEHDVM